MIETHRFDQVQNVSVDVCACGKWRLHHVHTGDRWACTCDECMRWRVTRSMIP